MISTNDRKVRGNDRSESKIGVDANRWKIREQMDVISTGVKIGSENIVELNEAREAIISEGQWRFLEFVRLAIIGALEAESQPRDMQSRIRWHTWLPVVAGDIDLGTTRPISALALTTTKKSSRGGRRVRIGRVAGEREASRDGHRHQCRSDSRASWSIAERNRLRGGKRRRRSSINSHGTSIDPRGIIGVYSGSIVLNNSLRNSAWRRLNIGRDKRMWVVC
jgi:hypothetical protein